jgi:arylsulfatase A-like enzyme
MVLCAFVVAPLAGCEASGRVHRAQPEAPNVVVFVTDDQRTGDGSLQVMPAVRRYFGRGGTRFANAYATTPLCCPSRASILTGRYAHNHGVNTLSDPFDLDQELTLQRYLRDAGYVTAMVGKYLNFWPVERPPPDFDRFTLANLRPYYSNVVFNRDGEIVQVEGYSTDYMRDRALAYLDEFAASGRPWFIYVAVNAPHRPAKPAPRHMRAPVPRLPRTPAMTERDTSDKRMFSTPGKFGRNVARMHARQLRSLMAVDELVGAFFERLVELGEAKNTLAFFLSDNGMLLGEHGMEGKRLPYTESVRVPMFARLPGTFEAGAVDRRPVANIDITPTVLDAASVEAPVALDGRSLLDPAGRRAVLLEHWKGEDEPVPDWASVRTPRYQYVEYYRRSGRRLFAELYDLRHDPWQLRNLLAGGKSRVRDVAERLAARLEELRVCEGRSCP